MEVLSRSLMQSAIESFVCDPAIRGRAKAIKPNA
jgi:hypothetical protein